MEIVSIVGLAVGIASLLGVIYTIGLWRGKIEGDLKNLNKMVNTLWQLYVIDPLRNRPGLAEQHSDFRLTKEGHDLIPDALKERLDELSDPQGDSPGIVVAYHRSLSKRILPGGPSYQKTARWSILRWLQRMFPRSIGYQRRHCNEDIASGYLVVEHLGLEEITAWASEEKLSVQEAIAILSAYLAER